LARWRRAGPHARTALACARRPPRFRPAEGPPPGVTSEGIRVASRGPRLAQGPRPRATKCPRHLRGHTPAGPLRGAPTGNEVLRVLSAWFLERCFGVLGQCVIKKSARAVLETCFYARDTENGRC
jgi:hypothetical protein